MLSISIVIPYCFQSSVFGSSYQRVWTVLVGVIIGIKLFCRHISWVKSYAWRTVGNTIYKGFSVKTIPRTIVNLNISLLGRILDAVQKRLLITEVLFPIDCVNLISGETIQIKYLFTIIGNATKIWSFDIYFGILCNVPFKWRF